MQRGSRLTRVNEPVTCLVHVLLLSAGLMFAWSGVVRKVVDEKPAE